MRNLPLFPNYFKWLVTALIVLNIIVAFVFQDFFVEHEVYSKDVLLTIFSLALLILFWTRRKQDDEMLVKLRLNTMIGAIVFLIVYVLISRIFSLVTEEVGADQLTAGSGIFTMMIFITLIFEIQLRKLNKGNNEE